MLYHERDGLEIGTKSARQRVVTGAQTRDHMILRMD